MDADPLLWVLVALREEYVEALTPYASLLPGRMEARYYMQHLQLDAAREAIANPAEEGERPFTADALEQLVTNLCQFHTQNPFTDEIVQGSSEFIEPLQLQVVCYQLWENLNDQVDPPPEITRQDIDEYGDVDKALAQFYTDVLGEVVAQSGVSELELRYWFEQKLITQTDARRPVHRGDAVTDGLADAVVEKLADNFLLRSEQRAGGIWYELIHDRFITPIRQDNARWYTTQPTFIQNALVWDMAGRPEAHPILQNQVLDDEQMVSVQFSLVEGFLTACRAAQAEKLREAAQHQKAEARKATFWAWVRIVLAAIGIAIALVFIVLAILQILVARSDQAAAEADTIIAFNQIEAAEATSTESAVQKSTAVAVGARAVQEQSTADTASQLAAVDRATAEAASTEAAYQIATADASGRIAQTRQAEATVAIATQAALQVAAITAGEQASRQSDLLLAQSLLDEAQKPIDTELSTLLILEARQLHEQANGGNLNQFDQALFALLNEDIFSASLYGHNGPVNQIAFSSSGGSLASVGDDGQVLLWTLEGPVTVEQIGQLEGAINRVLFTANDASLITGAEDGTVDIWPLAKADASPISLNSDAPIFDMALSPDETRLVTSHKNGLVQMWNLAETTAPSVKIDTWPEPANRPVRFDSSHNNLIIGNPNGSRTSWLTANDIRQVETETWQSSPVTALVDHPEGFAYGHENGWVRVERPVSYVGTRAFGGIRALDVAPDSSSFVFSGGDRDIHLCPLPEAPVLTCDNPTILTGHNDIVSTITYGPHGDLIASADRNGQIRLWQLDFTHEMLPPAYLATFSVDSATLFSGGQGEEGNHKLLQYDLAESPEPIGEINTWGNPVTAVVFSAAGDQVAVSASGSANGVVYVGPNVDELGILREYDHAIHTLAFSPDGRHLLVGGKPEGEILVYDLTAPQNSPVLMRGHSAPVTQLRISPDNQYLVSATEYPGMPDPAYFEAVRLWPLANVNWETVSSTILMPMGAGARSRRPRR